MLSGKLWKNLLTRCEHGEAKIEIIQGLFGIGFWNVLDFFFWIFFGMFFGIF